MDEKHIISRMIINIGVFGCFTDFISFTSSSISSKTKRVVEEYIKPVRKGYASIVLWYVYMGFGLIIYVGAKFWYMIRKRSNEYQCIV
jgi:hypothetical protein